MNEYLPNGHGDNNNEKNEKFDFKNIETAAAAGRYSSLWYSQSEKPGISSNLMTYIKILKNLMSYTFLMIPIGLKTVSLAGFTTGLVYTTVLNFFLVWLQLKGENKFKNDIFTIYSI